MPDKTVKILILDCGPVSQFRFWTGGDSDVGDFLIITDSRSEKKAVPNISNSIDATNFITLNPMSISDLIKDFTSNPFV